MRVEYITLSDLIKDVEPRFQFAFYKRFKAAIRGGQVEAVPTATTVQIYRQKSPLAVPEHLMKPGSDLDTWKTSVIESLSNPRKASRKLSVQISDLESGKIDFAEAAARYRTSLQPKQAGVKRGRRKEA